MTSGKSLQETINILQAKVNIVDVGVIINRQQNPRCSLPVKAVFYKTDLIKYRLKNISYLKKSCLCFAADITDPVKLLNILDIIGKYIVVCKIHYDIINTNSYNGNFKEELINLSIKYNFLIMEDRKFVDISSIVTRQYSQFSNWVDLVTVHSSVSNEVISKLAGVLIVANMSNNVYDLTKKAITLAEKNPNNMVGFITQKKINCGDLICMTPGISLKSSKIDDQNYRSLDEVDTDYIIVGRNLYNSDNIKESLKQFVYYK